MESLSSAVAPSRNAANTSGPKASDNTAPPTDEVEEKRPPMEKILPAERVRLPAENHPERGIQRDSIKELPMRLIHIRINWHLRQGLRFLCYRSSVSFFICAFWVYVERSALFLQGFILDCLDGFHG